MLQNEFLTAIRQIKAKVGENRAAQTALFTDETMEQIAQQLDKGQLAFIPQMDQHQFAAQLLSPMQGLEGISSESLQDLERAFGNVLNDMKAQHEMLKQSAANGNPMEPTRCAPGMNQQRITGMYTKPVSCLEVSNTSNSWAPFSAIRKP